MNVYLLPHHRLDPRFRYTLEREVPPAGLDRLSVSRDPARRPGLVRRAVRGIGQYLNRLRDDYDHMVHGHEQIRLSRLLLLMDRDPELTLVIPAGMSLDWALKAVRGVIRAGVMAHRSYVARNISTAVVIFILLFLIIPWHVPAFLFLPLIGIYAWLRYREDRLIGNIMTHLLEVRLPADGHGRFREDDHLAHLEKDFARVASPRDAYQRATEYLDSLDQELDAQHEQALLYNYYRDIGRLDPYERYQDRIRKRLIEAVRTVWHHIAGTTRWILRWIWARWFRGSADPSAAPASNRPKESEEEVVAGR